MAPAKSEGSQRGQAVVIDDADLKAAEEVAKVYERMTAQLGRVIIGQN